MNTTTRDEAPADHDRTSARRSGGHHATPSPGLLTVMWHYKFIIAAVTLASTATATVLSYTLDDKFQASITLSPVAEDSSGGRLGGVASLATEIGGGALGISSPGNTQKQEYLATLQSEALTERYIKENNLLPILFESKWDPVKHDWKDLPKDELPTLWKGNQFFKRHVRAVTTDTKTTLTTMMIFWKDPKLAAQWANGLVKLTNDYLRARAIDESERNVAYLKDQFTRTNVIGIQSAINSILEDQMKKAMIAQGSLEYALKVIDPAVPPEKRISPLPWLWIPLGFFIGLLACTVGAYVYRYRPIRLYLNHHDSER